MAASDLGIPTIRDRVVRTAAKLVLEPIFEADFEDGAYGYRPARGAIDAEQTPNSCAAWGYTGQIADHIHLNTANNNCICPTTSDPTWN
jgi:retron-type reverse transcriptase